MLAAQRLGQPPDPLVEEVRVAMALNGGVSLAVWMGGCAVELDCARRAHVGVEEVRPDDGSLPDRRIYHALCEAFRRELVIDLMSGSSAGGINGALLAAAIHTRRRLHPDFIRARWLELGDFAALLRKTSDPEPISLMDGKYFHKSLKKVFRVLLEPVPPAPPEGDSTWVSPDDGSKLTQDVKVDITTTDVRGRPRRYRDVWGEDLVASEYRQRFQFRSDRHYTANRLATAARSSASFPIAFEPWRVRAGRLLPKRDGARWVVDGGLLDNAPIRAVLDLIPSRPAERQVRRFVCYMNADPPLDPPTPDPHGAPALPSVLGYVLNLPRKATFVDQLAAIERAVNQGMLARETALPLLKLGRASLTTTAEALLSGYARRRRLSSLREVLDQPSLVTAADENLGARYELPWIPTTLRPPRIGTWGWGAGAARRVLHLLLDLIRVALVEAPQEQREELFAARGELGDLLQEIDRVRAELVKDRGIRALVRELAEGDDPDRLVAALGQLMADRRRDPALRGYVQRGVEIALEISPRLEALGLEGDERLNAARALFGDGWSPERAREPLDGALFESFLERVLAVEVTRRAFSADEDVESGQDLSFAQLTPCAPALLFSADPLEPKRIWDTPEEKLTGVRLGHFAAFYRASWRANDFMWGRLDAAVRVADLLVDPARARQVADERVGPPPWELLARELLPEDASADQEWLVEEALDEGAVGETLRECLEAALEEDLCNGDGRLTRAVCARAAQLEIIAHELPEVVRTSHADADLGSTSKPVDLPVTGPWRETIEGIRRGATFPKRLGRDDKDELASSLGLRTTTHAALVGLGTVRTARLPLARLLYMLRAPLLPVAGMVSLTVWYRLAVVGAYWAVAAFLVSRLVTIAEPRHGRLGALWTWPVLATFVAAVGVAAVVFVPTLRAIRASSVKRTLTQGTWAAALAAAGGLVALVWALIEFKREQVLVQAGAKAPPDVLVMVAVVVALGLPLSLRLPFVRGAVDKLLSQPWGGVASLVATLAPWVALGAFSVPVLWDETWPLESVPAACAVLAVFGAPVVGLAYLIVSARLRPVTPDVR
jgi:patatin-related protein